MTGRRRLATLRSPPTFPDKPVQFPDMPNPELHKLDYCVYGLHYHLVLLTESDTPRLSTAMIQSFREQADERCLAWDGKLLAAEGSGHHIHLEIELPPTKAIADFVNALKTGTSRRLRNDFAELKKTGRSSSLWARGYCVLSAGSSIAEQIRRYLDENAR